MLKKLDSSIETGLITLSLFFMQLIVYFFILRPLAKPYTFISKQSSLLSIEQGITYYQYSIPVGNSIIWLVVWLMVLGLSINSILEKKSINLKEDKDANT